MFQATICCRATALLFFSGVPDTWLPLAESVVNQSQLVELTKLYQRTNGLIELMYSSYAKRRKWRPSDA